MGINDLELIRIFCLERGVTGCLWENRCVIEVALEMGWSGVVEGGVGRRYWWKSGSTEKATRKIFDSKLRCDCHFLNWSRFALHDCGVPE